MKTVKIPCSKCEGKGKIQGYAMIAGGTCFQCKGEGYRLGTKQELEYYQERKEAQQKASEKNKEKKKLEEYFYNNVNQLKNNIEMVIQIKQTENIQEDKEAAYVYNRQKGKIKEFLTEYKKYKLIHKGAYSKVEEVLKQYNIKCV